VRFLLLELAKAHIESENLHDLALTMSTIADGGAYYNLQSRRADGDDPPSWFVTEIASHPIH
jgi:hypothetical protein